MSEQFYTVTELADELGTTPRAVRFYETKGLLKPRRAGSTRIYTHKDRARLVLILRGKRLGFSLADIKEYLDLYVVDTTQTEQLTLLQGKVQARLADLRKQQEDLEQTLSELSEINLLVEDALRNKMAGQ
ncbi:MerR family transcriptional regulator [Novispirillum itersonii]|uniref:DNA-binding transcriptional MerR regulator n=1 Tax=Novispirillum itersonii TaxID=189 RepID=A0A7W9ZIY8_NOVIT|nr:MerR family DNA-binding transcriptional regulator [Novispirillum itersonii]MBB6211124.1 DNA-binding transcriptional MerR regulator [Novispirillum itersonii]